MCIIEKKMPELMILAFLYVKWKKKRRNYSSGVLYVKNGKKMPKLMVPVFLYNINHKKKLFGIFYI
jgi:hypothetical protein